MEPTQLQTDTLIAYLKHHNVIDCKVTAFPNRWYVSTPKDGTNFYLCWMKDIKKHGALLRAAIDRIKE